MKKYLRVFYLTSTQISVIMRTSAFFARKGIVGKALAMLLDNAILYFFGMEVVSGSLDIRHLVVGHSTGVVLGGNGIRCTGTLHVSSGVVFARRYQSRHEGEQEPPRPMFVVEGDVTIGANSVLLGPLFIKGPVIIGALSLVTKDITEPGIYVGTPATKIRDLGKVGA